MNKIYRIIAPAVFTLTLMHFSAGAAETDKLAEAKKLHVQAASIAVDSPERAKLLKQAEEILKKIIADEPQSLEAHRKLMGIYLLQQDYSKGIRTMQDAINLSPEDPKLFIALAFLYEHSGAFEHAKAMLAHALELDPENKVGKEYIAAIQKKIDAQKASQNPHEGMSPMGMTHGMKTGQAPHKGMKLTGKEQGKAKGSSEKTPAAPAKK